MKIKTAQKIIFIKRIAQNIFKISFVSYVLFLLTEILEPGFVSNWFNLNYLLALVLITAAGSIIKE